MLIRRSPNGAGYTRSQPGRDRPEWVVAINRNAWSQSIGNSGRNQPVRAGYSLASVRSTFFCRGPDQPDGELIYTFSFHDPQKGIKIFPEVPVRSTLSFFGRLTHSRTYAPGIFLNIGPKKCSFTHYDKYGSVRPHILSLSDEQMRDLQGMIREDEPAAWRERYCIGMLTNVALPNGGKADCVSGTHITAIEPSYRWISAVSRSLSYAKTLPRRGRLLARYLCAGNRTASKI